MKNSYLTAVFLLFGICLFSGCEGVNDKGTVVIADSDDKSAKDFESDDISRLTEDSSPASETHEESKNGDSDISDSNDEDTPDNVVYVYVCGHVVSPGVYELRESDRICDALNKAGGVLEDGRADVIAQAGHVSDGMTVYVPGIDEEGFDYREYDEAVYNTMSGDRSGNGAYANDYNSAENGSYGGLLDINTMTMDEWMSLPGIGEAKASAIVNYRSEHGKFESIDELMDVPGIKEGVFNKIKDKIRV